MRVWKVAPVNHEPDILLSSWVIFEICARERHFIGLDLYAREGRVSSGIKHFDPVKRLGVTSSGRTCELDSGPGPQPGLRVRSRALACPQRRKQELSGRHAGGA
jgi:hypothetical protein